MKYHPLSKSSSPRTFILLALAATLLAGCGGSSSGSSGTKTATIKTQPTSKSAAIGASVTFTVAASGSGDLTYQWFKNGVAIDGATSASYTIAAVSSGDLGTYVVTVTNSLGTATSDAVTLSLPGSSIPVITTQPHSISAPSGSSATFSVVASGSSLTYQWFKDSAEISGATSASYNIASVGSSAAGTYFVRITNTAGSVDSNFATLTVAAATAPRITSQPTSRTVNAGSPTTLSVTATGTAPLTYQWHKDNTTLSGQTSSTLTISSATSGNAGGYYVVVTNGSGSTTSDTATITVVSAPVITTQPASQSVNLNSPATFTVVATGASLSYQWYKGTTAISGATGSSYTILGTAANEGSYKVKVTNSAGSVTSAAATLTVVGPPTITSQPSNLTVGVGSTATFTVTATGTGTLTYQWYKNGAAISGATSTSYTTSATVSGDSGATYYVRVSNSAGTTQSSTVTLTVDQAPVIVTQPTSITVTVGQTATFTVSATASGTLTYQWYKNGALISGATSASYTTDATVLTDSGTSYKVVVTNDGVISTTSNTVTLTVHS